MRAHVLALCALFASACGDASDLDAGGPDAAADAAPGDAGPADASPEADAALPDAGGDAGVDAGPADACVSRTFYADGDGDGHGDSASSMTACTAPSGYVSSSDDCDDACAACVPGGSEACDGLDNDCDGLVDGVPADAACAPDLCVVGGCSPLVSRVYAATGSHESYVRTLDTSAGGDELVLTSGYYRAAGATGPLQDLRFADRDIVFDPSASRVEAVSRIDAGGRVVWTVALSFQGSSSVGIVDVAIDDDGRVLVVGAHVGLSVGGLSVPAGMFTDSFVLLLSPSGVPEALRTIPSVGLEACAISSSLLIVGGGARNSAEFSVPSGTTSRGFVAALAPEDLRVRWSTVIGSGAQQAEVYEVGANTDVVAMGVFRDDSPVLGTTTTFRTVGRSDVFMLRLSAGGSLVRSLSIGTVDYEGAERVVMRGDDAICALTADDPAFMLGTVSIGAATRTGIHATQFVWHPDGSVDSARRLDMFYESFTTRGRVAGTLLAGTPFTSDGFSLPELGSSSERDVVLASFDATGTFTAPERVADVPSLDDAASLGRFDVLAATYDAARMVDGVALPPPPVGASAGYLWLRSRP